MDHTFIPRLFAESMPPNWRIGLWLFIGIGLPLGVIILLVDPMRARRARKRMLTLLRSRPTYSMQDWYDAHCAERNISFEAASLIIELLGRAYDCDPTQILPADSFAKELHVDAKMILPMDEDDEQDEFLMLLEEHLDEDTFEQFGTNSESYETVEDVIRWYDEVLKGRATASDSARDCKAGCESQD